MIKFVQENTIFLTSAVFLVALIVGVSALEQARGESVSSQETAATETVSNEISISSPQLEVGIPMISGAEEDLDIQPVPQTNSSVRPSVYNEEYEDDD